jgi:sec-independent protein translocase protein TatA
MSVGPWQIILILVIVLIIFGAGKLPRVMGDIAKGVKNFKAGLRDEEDDSTTVAALSLEEDKGKKSASDTASEEGKSSTAKD